VAFFIPEVDGFGVVNRGYKEVTVNGLPFSTIADSTAGGRQVDGFHGLSIEYMRSPKLLQADGGWNRIVWMPASIKERVKDYIPKELMDKIATEAEAKTVPDLKSFLESRGHPVVELWKAKPAEVMAPTETAEEKEAAEGVPVLELSTLPISAGGFKIILKDAKIHAKKVIIRAEKREKR
jgi:acetyl-CoA decarbonylase/synthase complex subunit beta